MQVRPATAAHTAAPGFWLGLPCAEPAARTPHHWLLQGAVGAIPFTGWKLEALAETAYLPLRCAIDVSQDGVLQCLNQLERQLLVGCTANSKIWCVTAGSRVLKAAGNQLLVPVQDGQCSEPSRNSNSQQHKMFFAYLSAVPVQPGPPPGSLAGTALRKCHPAGSSWRAGVWLQRAAQCPALPSSLSWPWHRVPRDGWQREQPSCGSARWRHGDVT